MSKSFTRTLPFILILVCAFVACYPLVHRGFYEGHDWTLELTRTVDYADALKGGFPVQWSPNLEHGYGSPIYKFFPPLFLTLCIIPFGVSLVTSIKIVIFILTVTGGVGMYFFSKRYFHTSGGLLSACVYVLAPYHFVDAFTRNAFAEFTALSIAPLIFCGIERTLHENQRGKILLITSIALFLLSHLISIIIYAPLILIYALVNTAGGKKGNFMDIGFPAFLGACIASFFIVPVFFELPYIQTWQLTTGKFDVSRNFVALTSLVKRDFWLSATAVSPFLLCCSVAAAFAKRKAMDGRLFLTLCLFFCYFVFCLFMMTAGSAGIWKSMGALKTFQFPWRLLSPMSFVLCFISGSLVMFARRRALRTTIVVVSVVSAAAALVYQHPPNEAAYVNEEITPDEIKYEGLKATVLDEYRPVWANNGPDYDSSPGGDLVSSDPLSGILAVGKKAGEQIFHADLPNTVVLTAKTLHFPGWKVYVGSREVAADITREGLMQFIVPAGRHVITMRYEDTPPARIGKTLSLLGAAGLVLSILRVLLFPKRTHLFVNKFLRILPTLLPRRRL